MTLKEFKTQIQAHKTLSLLDVIEKDGKDWIAVEDSETEFKCAVSVESVLSNPWEHIESVIRGIKAPTVMIHITRVVGYYSRTSNWNPSKLAELADRHAGNYSIGKDEE